MIEENAAKLITARYDPTPRVERTTDIPSLLHNERIIFVGGPIDGIVAYQTVAQLLLLAHDDSEKMISMYINCPGGSVYHGLAIYDTMQHIEPPVSTIAVGVTASMATFLLAAGTKGQRYALPHSTIHMHPAGGTAQGYAPDVEIQFKELKRVEDLLHHLLAQHTGQTVEQIAADFDRDRFMTAQESVKYGLVDHVLEPRKKGKEEKEKEKEAGA